MDITLPNEIWDLIILQLVNNFKIEERYDTLKELRLVNKDFVKLISSYLVFNFANNDSTDINTKFEIFTKSQYVWDNVIVNIKDIGLLSSYKNIKNLKLINYTNDFIERYDHDFIKLINNNTFLTTFHLEIMDPSIVMLHILRRNTTIQRLIINTYYELEPRFERSIIAIIKYNKNIKLFYLNMSCMTSNKNISALSQELINSENITNIGLNLSSYKNKRYIPHVIKLIKNKKNLNILSLVLDEWEDMEPYIEILKINKNIKIYVSVINEYSSYNWYNSVIKLIDESIITKYTIEPPNQYSNIAVLDTYISIKTITLFQPC